MPMTGACVCRQVDGNRSWTSLDLAVSDVADSQVNSQVPMSAQDARRRQGTPGCRRGNRFLVDSGLSFHYIPKLNVAGSSPVSRSKQSRSIWPAFLLGAGNPVPDPVPVPPPCVVLSAKGLQAPSRRTCAPPTPNQRPLTVLAVGGGLFFRPQRRRKPFDDDRRRCPITVFGFGIVRAPPSRR